MKRELSIFEQLEFSTTRITAKGSDKSSWSGTGFFFDLEIDPVNSKSVPIIITNKHVVEGAVELIFNFSKADDEDNPIYDVPNMVSFGAMNEIIMHPDPNVDLCGIPYNKIVVALNALKYKSFYRTFNNSLIPNREQLEELDAVEDILMIGYPNGLWDSRHNMPIIRRGITATPVWLDYEGKKEFVIDAACFPGSSGSPVMICNTGQYNDKKGTTYIGKTRLYLLGILHGGPQLTVTGDIRVVNIPDVQAVPQSISHIPNNLGYIIRSERILELIDVAKKKYNL